MQLYFAESPNGKKWKNPELIPFCKKEYNFMHPALSPDGKMLYFVSDKPGGEGGTDIYVSELGKKGWSKPVNLGTEINTSFNEGFPFIDANGRLFFSSKGHHGFGGFDIFVTEKEENGMWSQPENIGSPVNSSYDDISFCIDESFSKGMFSSSRETNNDNIYLFGISAPEILTRRSETSKTETAATTTPKVSASDVLTEKGIQNDENNPENVVSITQLEIMNGSEKSHPQNESKPLDSPSATKELPTAKVMPAPAIYPFIQIKALLRKGEPLSGKTFRMNSLQFEKSQYVITDEMTSNLNTLLDIMNRFPDLKVEVDVHTSSIGDDLENLEVSKARAAAIVAFMIENGIAAGRIQATGFGEKHLMNHCANDIPCSEKDHETNERVELSFF